MHTYKANINEGLAALTELRKSENYVLKLLHEYEQLPGDRVNPIKIYLHR